jgi:hypothetical protein
MGGKREKEREMGSPVNPSAEFVLAAGRDSPDYRDVCNLLTFMKFS